MATMGCGWRSKVATPPSGSGKPTKTWHETGCLHAKAYADVEGTMKQVQSLHNIKIATSFEEFLQGMYSDAQSVAKSM